MGGGETKTTNSTQSSTTNPWDITIPALSGLVGGLGGISTAQTPEQTAALQKLQSSAGGIPDMSGSETGAVNSAFGTNTSDAQDMLKGAYDTQKSNLSGLLDPNNLNPYNTPGLSDALGTLTNDITKQVGSTYAGSGRDPSGAGSFAGSLGRGLMQGEAPVITQAYQNNVNNLRGANSDVAGTAGSTASGITNQKLQQLAAQFQGLQGAGALPGLLTAPASTQLGAATTAYQQPIQNIGAVSSVLNPIAALGGQSTGQGTQTTETSKSLMSNILGGAAGLAGLNGALGSGWLGSLGSSLGPLMALSDENLKENIHEIGETHDGQPLYSYNYVWDDEPRVGLMAQDVEKRDPGAVVDIAGWKAVDYDRALATSRRIGLLEMAG